MCPHTLGGFFASGFKRAFELKDFGDTIPGHGGITDRFDCQVGGCSGCRMSRDAAVNVAGLPPDKGLIG